MSAAAQIDPSVLAAIQLLAASGFVVQPSAARGNDNAHETRIASDDGASSKGAEMCRIVIFQDRNKWRVRIVDRESGKATTHKYETEAEARAAAPKLQRQYERPVGQAMGQALADYRARLEAKGNKPRSIETTLGRITDVFVDGTVVTGTLTEETALAAWTMYITTPGPQTKRVPSVSTKANTLHEVRTFLGWLLAKGWVKSPLLADVKVEGRRKRGKLQLERKDDVRRFLALALKLAAKGDLGAVAAATALLLGLRASEIANTTVADLDNDGHDWIVRNAKTQAGNRRVKVPDNLRAVVLPLALNRPGSARLFGDVDRYWVRHAVIRVCKAAGVPVVSAHGLRGTHASLAVAAGVSGLAVAASIGHENFGVTTRHYATAESVAGAQVDRVLAALN